MAAPKRLRLSDLPPEDAAPAAAKPIDTVPVDEAAIARQVYAASPWYQRPLIAAGAELTRLGRGVQQLVTSKDSAAGRRLQQRIDADAPTQQGVHGVSGFIGRALPYVATLPLGTPEIAALNALGKAGNVAQLAVKGGIAAAEGAGYGALGETRTGENRLTNAGYGALGGVLGRGASSVVHGAARRLVREADPILRAATDIAQREGIPLHISQITQSTPLRTAASVAKYIPFSGADAAARNQQNAWNKALTRHVGDATERLDDRWLASQKQRFNDTYNAIWDDRNIALSPQAAARMQEVVNDAYRDLGTDGGKIVQNQFYRIFNDIVRAGHEGPISGRNYQTLVRDLAGVQPGTSTGHYVGRLRKELVKDAEQSLKTSNDPGDVAALELLKKTNQQYNNFKTLEKLLTRPAGARADITPAGLWSAVNARGPKATQEYRDLAKIGQTVLKDPIPDSGTPGRMLSMGLLGGGGVVTGGLIPTLATIAGGVTLGRALNSATLGNLLARNAAAPSLLAPLAPLLTAEGAIGTSRHAARQAAQRAFIVHQQQLHNADQ
ncbi:hypothetical protein R3J36_04915 [Xylella fastidiosa subsp. multiplex]|uniref:hypothetical protein n=2 Tax=Xylella fastidiosa TaxID=2371 RepID=UPI00234EFB74|nr:hypothetical protein [Xylella fastidiosa]MDC7969400.1 hypothetical protein [Xylella fastidiosa subsp. multiplex]WDF07877.1 hypothetical protein PT012_04915 [Xylella fastidiosa subsp. multiplex]